MRVGIVVVMLWCFQSPYFGDEACNSYMWGDAMLFRIIGKGEGRWGWNRFAQSCNSSGWDGSMGVVYTIAFFFFVYVFKSSIRKRLKLSKPSCFKSTCCWQERHEIGCSLLLVGITLPWALGKLVAKPEHVCTGCPSNYSFTNLSSRNSPKY